MDQAAHLSQAPTIFNCWCFLICVAPALALLYIMLYSIIFLALLYVFYYIHDFYLFVNVILDIF